MRLALVALVLCACGGATPVAVENRGGTARSGCDLPRRIEFEARRHGNLDADDPDYQTWSSWRVGLQLADRVAPRGTLTMVGDELTLTFAVSGTLDERCVLALWARSHDPYHIAIDLDARTGTIKSIDDVWVLGPPFPVTRR